MKITAITTINYPGVNAVFQNLTPENIEYEIILLEQLDKVKLPLKSDLFILGGYHPFYDFLLGNLDGKKAILITSSIGQMELTQDTQFLMKVFNLLNGGKIDYVFFGSKDMYDTFKQNNPNKVFYFPYPIKIAKMKKPILKSKMNAVGFFAPTHPRKNILNQLFAFINAKQILNDETLKLHTNVAHRVSDDPCIIYHQWLPITRYHLLLEKMKAVLNVFFTESLCYSSIEAVNRGSLPIVSSVIAENLGFNKSLEDLIVVNHDSVNAISNKLVNILSLNQNEYVKLHSKAFNEIVKLSRKNNKALSELLNIVI